jgi:hypothetical protein
MENIVDSDEWHREAKFSADNRGRYQADAVVRTAGGAEDAMSAILSKSAKPGTET